MLFAWQCQVGSFTSFLKVWSNSRGVKYTFCPLQCPTCLPTAVVKAVPAITIKSVCIEYTHPHSHVFLWCDCFTTLNRGRAFLDPEDCHQSRSCQNVSNTLCTHTNPDIMSVLNCTTNSSWTMTARAIKTGYFSHSLVHVCLFPLHVDVLRASTGFLAEVTERRRWWLADSFRISTGIQTDFNRSG